MKRQPSSPFSISHYTAFLLLGGWQGETRLHLAAAPSSEGRARCRDPQNGDILSSLHPTHQPAGAQPAVTGVRESPNQNTYILTGKTELIMAWAVLASLYILSCCPELAVDKQGKELEQAYKHRWSHSSFVQKSHFSTTPGWQSGWGSAQRHGNLQGAGANLQGAWPAEEPCWLQAAVQKCTCCRHTPSLTPDSCWSAVATDVPQWGWTCNVFATADSFCHESCLSNQLSQSNIIFPQLCLQRSCACFLSLPNQTEKTSPSFWKTTEGEQFCQEGLYLSNWLCHRKPGMHHSTVLHPRPCGTAFCMGSASLSAAAPPLVHSHAPVRASHLCVIYSFLLANVHGSFYYICSKKVPLCNYFSMLYIVDRHTKLRNVRLQEYNARLELKNLAYFCVRAQIKGVCACPSYAE